MTEESNFQAALDADPNNHALRLVFADWLEEQGDWRAAGYRWMGENRRAPGSFYAPRWNWFGWAIDESDYSAIPVDLQFWIEESTDRIAAGWVSKNFKTRQDAEEDLCHAVLKLSEEVVNGVV